MSETAKTLAFMAAGAVALLAGKPYVVTLHGTITAGAFDDFHVLRRAPRLARQVLDRARAVICVSEALADAARAAGVERVVHVPNGIDVPAEVGAEAEPPEILFAGRLAPEKGVEELVAATEGLNLVVCGDGPLRALVPQTVGFPPRESLRGLERRRSSATRCLLSTESVN